MPPTDRALLVSLRPRFAHALLAGDKTVELRRVPPSVECGTLVLMYSSSPERQLVGTARVSHVAVATPDEIWECHGTQTGLSRSEYDKYFAGTNRAVAIVIQDPVRLGRPRPLAELRRRWDGFRPPQSFRYVEPLQLACLAL